MHSLDRGLSRIVGGGKPPMQPPYPGPIVVTCPTCKGRAHAEQDPVTVTRAGVQSVVRYATCKCGCQMPSRRGAGARQTTVPLRFEVSADQTLTKPEEIPMEKQRKHRSDRATEEQLNDTRQRVRDAMGLAEITAPTLARSLSISTSTFYNFLNGKAGLALETNDRLNAWAEEVEILARKPLARKEPEPELIVVNGEPPFDGEPEEGSFRWSALKLEEDSVCNDCGSGGEMFAGSGGHPLCKPCSDKDAEKLRRDNLIELKPQSLHPLAAAERDSLAAQALEEWACAKLAYAMEGSGFRLPEGLRWRVSVERV